MPVSAPANVDERVRRSANKPEAFALTIPAVTLPYGPTPWPARGRRGPSRRSDGPDASLWRAAVTIANFRPYILAALLLRIRPEKGGVTASEGHMIRLRSDDPLARVNQVGGFFIQCCSRVSADAVAPRGARTRKPCLARLRQPTRALSLAVLAGLLGACWFDDDSELFMMGPGDTSCGLTASLTGPTTVAIGAPVQLTATWGRAKTTIDVKLLWSLREPPGSTATLTGQSSQGGTLINSFTPDVVGAYRVGFVVEEDRSDLCGDLTETQSASAQHTVQAVSFSADAGLDQYVDVGATITLDGSNSVGSNLTYVWSRIHQTASSAAPASGTGPILSFPLNEPDSLRYELEITDGSGNTDVDTVVARSNAPDIQSLNPSSGPVGTTVTIVGRNFSPNTSQNAVTFNGLSTTVTTAAASQLGVTVPMGATTGPVVVTVTPVNPAADVATGPTFTVTTGAGMWTLQPSGVTNGSLQAVSFPTAMTGYAVGQSASQVPIVTKSTDGGATWSASPIPGGTASSGLLGASFSHPDTGTVVGQFDQIYRTEDGGVSWTAQTTPLMSVNFTDVSFVDGLNGVAVGASLTGAGGVVVRTTDGGATQWSSVAGTTQNLNAVHMVSATEGWAVGNGATILHATTGTNWSFQTPPGGVGALFDVFFLDNMNGWAVGNVVAGGLAVLVTTDGGANWNFTATQPAGGASSLNGVLFTDTMTGVVVGNAGIFRTVDGGATWVDETSTSSGNAKPLRVEMTGSTTGVAVGGPTSGSDAAIWRRQ